MSESCPEQDMSEKMVGHQFSKFLKIFKKCQKNVSRWPLGRGGRGAPPPGGLTGPVRVGGVRGGTPSEGVPKFCVNPVLFFLQARLPALWL